MTIEQARVGWAAVLRRLQADHGTYPKIGEALGVHENTVQNWMTKGMLPDFRREVAIAEVVGMTEDALRAILDPLRRDFFLQRSSHHPLTAPEVAPVPFADAVPAGAVAGPPRKPPQPVAPPEKSGRKPWAGVVAHPA